MSRIDTYYENKAAMIEYFKRRKQWARETLKAAGIIGTVEYLKDAEFEGYTFTLYYGPRGGIRIEGVSPWTGRPLSS